MEPRKNLHEWLHTSSRPLKRAQDVIEIVELDQGQDRDWLCTLSLALRRKERMFDGGSGVGL